MPDFDLDSALEASDKPKSLCCSADLLDAWSNSSASENGEMGIIAKCVQCGQKHWVLYQFDGNIGGDPRFAQAGQNYEGCPICHEGLDLGNGGRVTVATGLRAEDGALVSVPLDSLIWFDMNCPDCGSYREVYRQNGRPAYA